MLIVSTGLKDERAKVVGDRLNQVGANPAPVLRFYSGAKPENLGAITTQVLLCELELPVPCYSVVTNGQLVMNPVPESLIAETGIVAWGRLIDTDGGVQVDFDVTGAGGGGDLEMTTIEAIVYQGATLSLPTAWYLG